MENDCLKNVMDTFETSSTKVMCLNSPVKSKCDKKEYRVIKLENGLTALLISDFVANTGANEYKQDTKYNFREKMSSCCFTVNVGSFSDPPRIQGLAHFLEHVITMGSEKYPEENEYAKFVKGKGGSLLADTGYERTKYIFQIHPDHLLPAMDRFANCFINPTLMKKEMILRERESVDNEFYLDSASDYDRLKKFFRIILQHNHPASKFSCGNLVTLRDNVSEEELYSELIAFKNRHYSANRMTLAVQATLSLDTLEGYVRDCFSRLPVNHLSPYDFTKFIGFNSFDPLKFRKIYTVKSVNNCHEMELKWILPPSKHLYRNKPIHYICHLMNHEARGSLSHYLREKQLCDRLSVNREQYSLFTVLTVNLVLPRRDQNHPCTKKILEAVFSYVNMLRRVPQDLHRRNFEELQSIAEYKFDFADEINAASNVQALCCSMQSHPATDYLTGNELYFEFDDRQIQTFLDNLTPNNVFIVVLNDKTLRDEEFNETEPWYKIRYLSEEIPDEWIRKLETIESFPEFFLPGPNPFFVTDSRMIDQPVKVTEFPVKIETDDGKIEIWYKPNLTFGLPHSYAYVRLITRCSADFNSVKTCVMLRLFEVLIHEILLEDLFYAKIAGLTFNVAANGAGIFIKVNGFSQKVPVLLKILVKFIADFGILVKEDVFDLVKTELLNYYSTISYDPGSLASEISLSILDLHSWTSSEKHAALMSIKFNQFIDFARNLTNTFIKAQCLVQGNASKKDAVAIIKEAVEPLKFCSFTNESWNLSNNSYQRLPMDRKFCKVKNLNVSDVNSVVMNHYKTNVNCSSILDLPIFKEFLEMLIQEPLFHQLRTKEQLGYSLSIFTTPTGFHITIYSPTFKFTTEYIDKRIDCFVKSFLVSLNQMTKNEFDASVEDFVKVKKCEDVNLKDEVERNWFAITTGSSIFDERREQILIIKSLTIREFHRWINNILINNSNFKNSSIKVVGNI